MRARGGFDGVEELRQATAAVGLDSRVPSADSGVDLAISSPVGEEIAVIVKRVALASADSIERQLDRWDATLDEGPEVIVVVADRVTDEARRVLNSAGRSWLDLRGHLRLVGAGIFVDAEVPALTEKPGLPKSLTGQVSQEIAALLLLDPTKAASIREVARNLQRSPSTVSAAMAALRRDSLVDDQRRPVIPALFWELAAHWNPVAQDLRRSPSPTVPVTGTVEEALRLGLTDVEETNGWALTDTTAAAAYGAPVSARSDHPPDFYVPDQTTMRRALHILGPASAHETRAATIRVAPLPVVCASRIDRPDEEWPLARPLFVALDLASDPGRGREVLNGWTPPPEAGHRVW
jgi:hypothetical protein